MKTDFWRRRRMAVQRVRLFLAQFFALGRISDYLVDPALMLFDSASVLN
jgi:hypothetical protein